MKNKSAIIVDNKIQIEFDYDRGLVDKVREIEGRSWNKPKEMWLVPATPFHASRVLEEFGDDGFYIEAKIRTLAKGKIIHPKMKYLDGMYDFQKVGHDFVVNAGGRCIVADEMGTGKTIEALSYINSFGGKTLIVCPTNVSYKWKYECERWIPNRSVGIIVNGKSQIPDTDFIIISYGLLKSFAERLNLIPFDVLVADEAHYCKNYKAQRTRLIKMLVFGGIRKVLFLSGTPFQNRPAELFPLLNMLDPIGYSNFFTYAMRYCGAQHFSGGWYFPPNGATNRDELARRLGNIMIRRTKREVLTELPELTRTVVPVELSNKSAYRAAVRDVQTWLKNKNREALNPEHVLTKMAVLRQVVGEGKVEAAIELAENILQDGKQVVLFAHHKDIVDAIYQGLKMHGVAIISGEVKAKERADKIKEFLSSDSKIRVMICTTAGAEGIDLYTASDLIMVERQWTPAVEEQMEARLHRVGQKNAVTAYYLVAKNTVDERLDNLVRAKRSIIGSIIPMDDVVETVLDGIVNS